MKDASRAALLKPRRKQLQFLNRWTGASQWPSASLTHPRSWEIVFYGEEVQRRPQPRFPPILAVEPAALHVLPPPQLALLLLLLGPRARQSTKESTPVRDPARVLSTDLAWSFSFYCPSQCLLSAPGQCGHPPRDSDVCLHPCLVPGPSLLPFRHLFRAGPGGLELVQCGVFSLSCLLIFFFPLFGEKPTSPS